MKSEKGVTMTSLVIYVVCLIIIFGMMSVFSGYFYKNVNQITIGQNADEQYSRFLAYITKDINSDNLINVKTSDDVDFLSFTFNDLTEHQYIYKNKNIYYISIKNNGTEEKKVLLCEYVESNRVFSYNDRKIDLNFKINNKNYSTSLNVKL